MANKKNPPNTAFCSFCGRPRSAVQTLIAGPEGMNICDECVEVCNAVLTRNLQMGGRTPAPPIPKPHEIKAKLDEYVVGQEQVKKILAVAVHNHYKRLTDRQTGEKKSGADGVFVAA